MDEGAVVGLTKVISEGFDGKFVTIVGDANLSIYRPDLIRETLLNFSDKKYAIHFLYASICPADVSSLVPNAFTYKMFNFDFKELEDSVKICTTQGRRNIILIEDWGLLTLALKCPLGLFLQVISRHFHKTIIFIDRDSIRSSDIGPLYTFTDTIAHITSLLNPNFITMLLRFSSNGKIKLEKSKMQIGSDGKPICTRIEESTEKDSNNISETLANLTTFKLTLEDGERDSKDRVNLPYFQAQTTEVVTPDEDFDELYDDEDEEV